MYNAGKLHLKIPWKNLYSAPVVAEIDGLYMLAGPASGKVVCSDLAKAYFVSLCGYTL